MKVEFYTNSLDSIVHWLNIKSSQVFEDGHAFAGSTIETFPQGLLAQAMFLTPHEVETGKYGLNRQHDDDDLVM